MATTTTRQRLIDAAYELFARHGFHAVGLDRILDNVGVSKQTFYNHFESKDGLVLEVLARRSAFDLNSFQQLLLELGGDDPHDQLDAVWDVLDVWFNAPDFRGCIFITAAAEFPSQYDPAHQAAKEHALKFQQMLRRLAARAGTDDPQALAEQLHVLVDGALVLRHVCGNDRAAGVARETAELVMQKHLGQYQPSRPRRATTAVA